MKGFVIRACAAALLLAGGLLHYSLWKGGYRHVPKIGPLFLANFAGSVALAGAVVASRRKAFAVAGILFAAGSLAALVLSRTVGVFGFTETIWSAPAIRTLASEVGAIATLGIVLAIQGRGAQPLRSRPALVPIPRTSHGRAA